jgi:hypothetical protein
MNTTANNGELRILFPITTLAHRSESFLSLPSTNTKCVYGVLQARDTDMTYGLSLMRVGDGFRLCVMILRSIVTLVIG